MKKIFVTALLATSLAGFGQSKLTFQKGQKVEVVTESKTSSSMQLMGQAMESNASASVTQNFDVQDVKDGIATIEAKTKNVQLKTEGGMGQNLDFNSDKPDDMKGDIGKILDPKLKSKYTIQVDAAGKVTGVKEEKVKAEGQEGDMAAMLLTQIGVAVDAPKIGESVLFKVLPDKEVKKGETWTNDQKDENGSKKITYTVKDITEDEIIVDFIENGVLKTTQQIMGTEANISGNTKTTGQVIVNKHTGLLKQRTATIDGQQTIEAQGMSIPSTTKATIITTVKPA